MASSDKMRRASAQTIYFNLFGVNPNYGGAIPSDLDGPVLLPRAPQSSSRWTTTRSAGLPSTAFHLEIPRGLTTPSNSTFESRAIRTR